MFYIGIDPGQSGGIAVLHHVSDDVKSLEKMPATERDVLDLIAQALTLAADKVDLAIAREHKDPMTVVEAHPMIVGPTLPTSDGPEF